MLYSQANLKPSSTADAILGIARLSDLWAETLGERHWDCNDQFQLCAEFVRQKVCYQAEASYLQGNVPSLSKPLTVSAAVPF